MTAKKTEITPAQAAALLDLTPGWMAALRSKRKGPPSYKQGRRVFYYREEVEAWRKANTSTKAGEAVLVVSIKTMALGSKPDGTRYVTINGKDHAVDASTGAVLIAQKKGK